MLTKRCVNYNMAIFSMAISLLALSAMADELTPTPPSSPSIYDARPHPIATTPASQNPPLQTLGTLQSHEWNNGDVLPPAGRTSTNTFISSQELATQSLQPIETANIVYITGGVGNEERDKLQSVKDNYNLHIMSAYKDGAFAGSTHILIKDTKDVTLADAIAGPLFYAKLPSGTYVIEATTGDQLRTQRIIIKQHKASSVNFRWE